MRPARASRSNWCPLRALRATRCSQQAWVSTSEQVGVPRSARPPPLQSAGAHSSRKESICTKLQTQDYNTHTLRIPEMLSDVAEFIQLKTVSFHPSPASPLTHPNREYRWEATAFGRVVWGQKDVAPCTSVGGRRATSPALGRVLARRSGRAPETAQGPENPHVYGWPGRWKGSG